jgi:hypothetical protein
MQVQRVSTNSSRGRIPASDRYVMEEVTFRKTIAGHNEFEHRHVLSRPELRRLLILIDGKKPVETLVSYFRAFEFASLLDELLALGLIEPVCAEHAHAHAASKEALGDQSSLKPMQFEAARRAALHAATELLGTQARSFCAKLVMCQDSMALRVVLSQVQEQLSVTLGDDAATLFIETVRDAVKMSR